MIPLYYYDVFSGRTLEQYFQANLMKSGKYSQMGNWWNRKGENELDTVAINEFDLIGMVAEVKRNPIIISIHKLKDKIKIPSAL